MQILKKQKFISLLSTVIVLLLVFLFINKMLEKQFAKGRISVLSELVSQNRAVSDDYFDLAVSHITYSKKNINYAIELMHKGLSLNESDPGMNINLGETILRYGEQQKGMSYLEKAENILDNSDLKARSKHYHLLAEIYYTEKKYSDCARVLEKAIKFQIDDRIYFDEEKYVIDREFSKYLNDFMLKVKNKIK